MNIINFESKDTAISRQNAVEAIKDSNAFILIRNDSELTYQWANLSHEQVIAALELVKMAVLKEMI